MLRYVQRWTLSKDKEPSGISRVQGGASSVICPCYQGTVSLSVTHLNEQRFKVAEGAVRCSKGQEFGIETSAAAHHMQARLTHYLKLLVTEATFRWLRGGPHDLKRPSRLRFYVTVGHSTSL